MYTVPESELTIVGGQMRARGSWSTLKYDRMVTFLLLQRTKSC